MKKQILTLLVLSSIAFTADCTRNAEETVNCTDTGLMWQDDSNASSVSRNWQGAIDHCEGLSFAGYDDWRLPNYNELKSIVDYEKSSGAKIKNGFANTSSGSYWSSTSGAYSTGSAWLGNFSVGSDHQSNKSYSTHVRCVRAGQ